METNSEFKEKYFNKLKQELNVNDIYLDKSGFIGFFIDMMANMNFDIKNYNQQLFSEAFPITARDENNLILHSEIYGYIPKLTKPAVANAVLELDLSTFLKDINIGFTKEYYLSKLKLKIDSVVFNLNTIYKFICKRISESEFLIYCETDKDVIPLIQAKPFIQLKDLYQFEITNYRYYLPNYPKNTFHIVKHQFNNSLYEISVKVREEHKSEFKEFRVSLNKSTNNIDTDEIVFYKLVSSNEIQLEFGSGKLGKYVPGAEIQIEIKSSLGAGGNIGKNSNINYAGELSHITYDSNNVVIDSSLILTEANGSKIKQFIKKIEFKGSSEGVDQEKGNVLKHNLLNYIQTRDNLVTTEDFNKNMSKNVDVLFKKSSIVENIIYVYNYLKNNLDQPIYTLTTNVDIGDFESQLQNNCIIHPTFNINSLDFICPYYFEFNSTLNLYEGYLIDTDAYFNPDSVPVTMHKFNFNIKSTVLNLHTDLSNNKLYLKVVNSSFSDSETITVTISQLVINQEPVIYDPVSGDYILELPEHIKTPMTIKINILDAEGTNFEFSYFYVQNVRDVDRQLRLKKYGNLLINIPLVDKLEYYENVDIVYKQLIMNYQNTEYQMISDDVQLRFANSFIAYERFVSKLTKQMFNFDIYLPLKVSLEVIFDKDLVMIDSLDIEDISNNILFRISEFITDRCDGLSVKLYRSAITDVIHEFDGVKNVTVVISDKNNTVIPNGIETIHRDVYLKKLTKEEYLEYSSIYFWLDVNNISIVNKVI